MSFNIVLRGAALAFCGLALCACAGPGGKTSSRADGDAIALSTPAEPRGDALPPEDPIVPRSERIPTAGEVFDFHPPGSRPGSWREPFIVSYTEGPLNSYRLKTLAELHALQDHRYDLVPPSALAAR